MNKERTEILLEQVISDVKGIAEGHGLLRKEMREMRSEFTTEVSDIKTLLKFHSSELKDLNDKVTSIGGKVDSIDTKLDKHILQPSHA
jgi:hypothetical protein